MSLKLLAKLKRSIEIKLALWYSFIFIVSWSILFATGFILLSKSIKAKDRQIVRGMLDKYEVIAKNYGTDALVSQLKKEQLAHITGGHFIAVASLENEVFYVTLPYEWRSVSLESIQNKLSFKKEKWISITTNNYLPRDDVSHRTDELEILGREINGGAIIYAGHSAESREEFLEHFRDIFFLIMIPVAIISLFIGAFLAWRAMRPVRDLTGAVKKILTGQIETRVPLRTAQSDLRDLGEQFNVMLDRIEELINGMREALDNVAHDLRTPLTRMRISIEQAVVKDDPAILREALFDCAEESNRISSMLTTLMDISEAETGVMKLNCETINISEFLTEITDLFTYTAKEKGITVHVDPVHDSTFYGDRARLKQAVSNLFDNAIKYTGNNGYIQIKADHDKNFVRLIIRDNGMGIHPDDIPKIFDRLYRADKSRSKQGLGLGLAMVKAVVLAHNGNVTVESEPGKGAVFILSLPSSNS